MRPNGDAAPKSRRLLTATEVAFGLAEVLNSAEPNLDAHSTLKQAEHIQYGLSAEDEFLAIAAWLGHLKFGHGLANKAYASSSQTFRVPDALLVTTHGSLTQPVLVEVKTSSNGSIRLTDDYLGSLEEYATNLSLPLTFAFRFFRGAFWILVDSRIVRARRTDAVVRMEDVFPYDLMGYLLGDFQVIMHETCGLSFVFDRLGKPIDESDGFSQRCVLSKAGFHDKSGLAVKQLPRAVVAAIISAAEECTEVTDSQIAVSFLAKSGTCAQHILRHTLQLPLDEGEMVAWKHAPAQFEHVVSRQELLQDLKQYFGTFTRYILHIQPKELPLWMSSQWQDAARSIADLSK